MKKPSTFHLLLLLLLFSKHAEAQQQPAFRSEEITFKSVGDVSLSGTLTIPNGTGPYPAIVLLGGSERMNRVAMYKWSNADSIVFQGIAVFSFDSPGVGKSEGSRWKRTAHERTEDALAAIRAIEKRKDICAFAAVGETTVLAAGGMDAIREWFATAEMVYPDGSRSELEITPEGRIFLDETRSYKIVPEEGETMEKFRGKKVTFYRARRAGVANERIDGRQVDK